MTTLANALAVLGMSAAVVAWFVVERQRLRSWRERSEWYRMVNEDRDRLVHERNEAWDLADAYADQLADFNEERVREEYALHRVLDLLPQNAGSEIDKARALVSACLDGTAPAQEEP